MNRKISIGVINIATHPHSEDQYRSIFKMASSLEQSVQVWGEKYARFHLVSEYDEDPERPLFGTVFKYTEIDLDKAWFDIEAGDEVTPEELALIKIPENLRPNLETVRYAFYPKSHKFVYVTHDSAEGGMSVRMMKSFLTGVLNDPRLITEFKYNLASVTEVQDTDSINEVFDKCVVSSLRIEISRPNPDTPGGAGRSVEEEMEDGNIAEYVIEQKAEKGKGLVKTESTSGLIEEAAKNGSVSGVAYDENDIRKPFSSTDHPLSDTFLFDTKSPYVSTFMGAARKILGKIPGLK